MSKMITTLNLQPPPKPDNSRTGQWEENRSVFPIYIALAKHLQIEIPFAHNKRVLPEKADLELFTQVDTWLNAMDHQVMVHQLRHLLQMTTLNASESGLRALIMRHLKKTGKTLTDRDKIDFLLVQYFALCAPAKIFHKQIELSDVAQVMKPVFGEVNTEPLPWCAPLQTMIQSLRGFKSLRDILKTNFIEQGRRVKESAGNMFYDPSAMLAFVQFNFLLRRTLIELMHADLIYIRSGINHLESAGAKTIDCQSFGLTAAEPIAKVRQCADEWKQPFQKEYTERSVNQAFDKLLSLRSDIERAVQTVLGKSMESSRPVTAPAGTEENLPAKASERRPVLPPAEEAAEPEPDFESCMEQIWEQLIAAPPSRGRSMTTVKIGNARVLMSSWEVTAFVSEDGPAAEDLRRAVAARAMVTAVTEKAKTSPTNVNLERVLPVARVEVSRLQERVEIAKQAKDTEAAVNLGISTKRLLSALDEAEKL
ncbi:MAG: hypothetical protein WAK20_17640 [Candidatus Acidiferrum sp.]